MHGMETRYRVNHLNSFILFICLNTCFLVYCIPFQIREKQIHIYVTTTLLRKSIVPLNYKIHDDLQLIQYTADIFRKIILSVFIEWRLLPDSLHLLLIFFSAFEIFDLVHHIFFMIKNLLTFLSKIQNRKILIEYSKLKSKIRACEVLLANSLPILYNGIYSSQKSTEIQSKYDKVFAWYDNENKF